MKTMAEKWTKQQQDAIASFGHDILVSAGAGSGKTAVLSQRVYQLVGEHKIDIDHLLVLTFTNKAAAEMKSRIRKKISEDTEGLFGSDEERKRQVNKIDSAFIMTFDAYALFLVKKYHYLLGIDRDIGVIDVNILTNEEDELLDQIMEEEYRKKDPVFIDLIDTYCVKNDDVIRDFILKLHHALEMVYGRKEYVSTYRDRFYCEEAIDETLKQYADLIKDEIRTIGKLTDEFSYGVENVGDYFLNLDGLKDADRYSALKDAIDQIGITNKRLPSKSGVSDIKKQIGDRIRNLKKMTVSDEKTLRRQIRENEKYDLYLLKLAEKLNERISVFKDEKRAYSFGDIFRMSIDLVDGYEWICKEISDGFDEILIDEYQDTNDLQDEFISRIARNNVYMVGDIKQSIYRFRNANPALFMKKYFDYKYEDKGELIVLPHNFRSRKEVIEDIDAVFDRLMDLDVGGADYATSHHMECGRNDEVYEGQDNHLEIYDYFTEDEDDSQFNKHETEAFIMAEDIKEKYDHFIVRDKDEIRKAKYSDFCVIVDRTTQFDLYKKIFTYFDIPCVIEKDERMAGSDLVVALKAIFALLEKMHEDDWGYDLQFAFVSLARSFLVNMKDEEIYQVFKDGSFRDSELIRRLMPLSERIDEMSIADILDEIIREFDVCEKLYLIGDVKENLIRIDYLYQLSHSLASSGYDHSQFNEYLDRIFEGGDERDITYRIDQEADDAVRIINIHKAKGLQYKICYFPGLSVDFNLSDVNQRFLFSRQMGIIAPVNIKGRGLKNSIRKQLYVKEYLEQEISEKLRLLYVALTRSEEKMIMVTALENKHEGGKMVDRQIRSNCRCFADLLNTIYGDLDEKGYIKDVDIESLGLSKDYDLARMKDLSALKGKEGKEITFRKKRDIVPEKLQASSFSKKAALIDKETIRKMELGTKLHYYLETLDFMHPDYSLIEKRFAGMIRRFMKSDIMKDVKKGKPYKEYEFIYEEGNERKHGFIDLLMEYEDHFDIIDYKTKNIDDEHYDEQLRGYRDYIASVFDKDVNCYLYSIIDGVYREVK